VVTHELSRRTCRHGISRCTGATFLKNSKSIEDGDAKRSEAKYKDRSPYGQNSGAPKRPVNRREYGPGQHGQRQQGQLSDFGVQLRAKQKPRDTRSTFERQFHGTFMSKRPHGQKGDR